LANKTLAAASFLADLAAAMSWALYESLAFLARALALLAASRAFFRSFLDFWKELTPLLVEVKEEVVPLLPLLDLILVEPRGPATALLEFVVVVSSLTAN
jgi:hypothetical protein